MWSCEAIWNELELLNQLGFTKSKDQKSVSLSIKNMFSTLQFLVERTNLKKNLNIFWHLGWAVTFSRDYTDYKIINNTMWLATNLVYSSQCKI